MSTASLDRVVLALRVVAVGLLVLVAGGAAVAVVTGPFLGPVPETPAGTDPFVVLVATAVAGTGALVAAEVLLG
jgi:hypothetical protein